MKIHWLMLMATILGIAHQALRVNGKNVARRDAHSDDDHPSNLLEEKPAKIKDVHSKLGFAMGRDEKDRSKDAKLSKVNKPNAKMSKVKGHHDPATDLSSEKKKKRFEAKEGDSKEEDHGLGKVKSHSRVTDEEDDQLDKGKNSKKKKEDHDDASKAKSDDDRFKAKAGGGTRGAREWNKGGLDSNAVPALKHEEIPVGIPKGRN